mgnify:CR=1 FL=1
MPVNIAPGFSVYALVARMQKYQDSTIINTRRTMNTISYEIENATLIDGTKTRIFAAFQRMSRFLPQVERYKKLAARSESIYVFGIPDATMPQIPNITYIHLEPQMQLAKEWFLVSYGQDYASALATEELTHIDNPDDERRFKGIWTFEISMVAILEEWLTRTVDAQPLLINEAEHNQQEQQRLLQNIRTRMSQTADEKASATLELALHV